MDRGCTSRRLGVAGALELGREGAAGRGESVRRQDDPARSAAEMGVGRLIATLTGTSRRLRGGRGRGAAAVQATAFSTAISSPL